MNTMFADKRGEVDVLCKEFGVRRLELFGSVACGSFDEHKSDVDFLVIFHPCTPEEHATRYFGLLAALEDLFGRRVDLVEVRAIRNPYFLQGIEDSRTLVYGS